MFARFFSVSFSRFAGSLFAFSAGELDYNNRGDILCQAVFENFFGPKKPYFSYVPGIFRIPPYLVVKHRFHPPYLVDFSGEPLYNRKRKKKGPG